MQAKDIRSLSLNAIGKLIQKHWKRIYFGATPYVRAMQEIDGDMYGQDSWTSIVAYFLSNARTWKGPEARTIKAELNRRLKSRKYNGDPLPQVSSQIQTALPGCGDVPIIH